MNAIKDNKKTLLRYVGLEELASHGPRGILAFWTILGMAFFLFGDQNLIAPNMKNIANSFGIIDQKEIDWKMGGLIPILFFILGGTVSLSMGYLSQTISRKSLLLVTVLLGEIPCFLTAYSSTYNEFLLLRTLCGFGLGGIFPILFSLIGDYFSSQSRAVATGFVSLAMGLGIGVGQLMGGILGEGDPINGWRQSFIYMSVPSFFFALIYLLFCREPKRGGAEDIQSPDELSHRISLKDFKILFQNKTNLGIFLQGLPGCIPWGVFFVYLVDYYENVYGFGKAEASGLVTFAAIGVFIGTFFGGVLGQWLYNKNKKWQPILCMVTTFIGVLPAIYLLYAQGLIEYKAIFLVLNVFTGVLISITGANVRAVLLNVNVPKSRSAIFSIYNLTDDLGKGLGPAISAIILGSTTDRGFALSISILFWIPCALAWIIIIRNYENDEAKMRKQWELEVKGA
ncbi:transporter transmembrane protein [Leptospira ryugenii]|uniref:Transporter transmembrane protein n=1 Tax=Leptospira ryugenii TaxID=1917863 RepID=A0A2P2E4E9_9LEPT|nr:MFS transporter [Leptospira ryugenii]GBF51742.1 transporter transmembrane protein [Leptospira ryugenii]